MPQFLTDGKTFRAAVWNAGFDPVEGFEIQPPAGWSALRMCLHFDAGGNVAELAVHGGRINLPRPLRQWELAVLA